MSRPGWCKAPDRVWEEGRSPPFYTLGLRGACWSDLCIGFRSEATPLRCCATRLRAQPNGGLGRNLFARPGACTPVCEPERGVPSERSERGTCSGRAHAFSANERSQTGLPEHPEQGRAFGWVPEGRSGARLRSMGDPRVGFGARRVAEPSLAHNPPFGRTRGSHALTWSPVYQHPPTLYASTKCVVAGGDGQEQPICRLRGSRKCEVVYISAPRDPSAWCVRRSWHPATYWTFDTMLYVLQ